jgi:hypothetical protein
MVRHIGKRPVLQTLVPIRIFRTGVALMYMITYYYFLLVPLGITANPAWRVRPNDCYPKAEVEVED